MPTHISEEMHTMVRDRLAFAIVLIPVLMYLGLGLVLAIASTVR